MNKLKSKHNDVFKARTKEWDANEWQGRSQKQVETNEKLSGISILLIILFTIGYVLYNAVTNIL